MNATYEKLEKAEAMKFKKHMKRLDLAGAISCAPDKNERFVLRTCAGYLDRLLGAFPLANRQTIDLLVWILGPDIVEIGEALLENMNSRDKEKYESELKENILDPEEAAGLIHRITRNFGRKEWTAFVAVSRSALARRSKTLAYSGQSDIEKKLGVLSKMFSLSEQEQTMAGFLYIISAWQQGEDYFVDYLHCQDISGRRYLKIILRMTDREMTAALTGTLARIELYGSFSN